MLLGFLKYLFRISWLTAVTLILRQFEITFYFCKAVSLTTVDFRPCCTVTGLIDNWIYILPAGSPGSYSMSHTGDTYLGLRSLNGEGLNTTPSLQPQVRSEDGCRVDLSGVNLPAGAGRSSLGGPLSCVSLMFPCFSAPYSNESVVNRLVQTLTTSWW